MPTISFGIAEQESNAGKGDERRQVDSGTFHGVM
jgi:hypothetical protein